MADIIKDTLLLVGDAASERFNLRNVFRSVYNLLEAESEEQAVFLLHQNRDCIAAVIADVPLEDGRLLRRVVEAANNNNHLIDIPVIVLVNTGSEGVLENRAFLLGAADVTHKPYNESVIRRRVQVMVDLYLHRWNLENMVQEQNEALRNANQAMLDGLSAIIEHRNTESGNHILRIRRFAYILLEELASVCPEYELDEKTILTISNAACLHDVGKIAIPDLILNKPGKLTPEEFEVMKTHTSLGSRMVQKLGVMDNEMYLRFAYNIALYHHERWDGNGYPMGLKEDEIPICAQVVGIVDAFDALISPRVYKPAFPLDKAFNMILNGDCGIFSPKLLEVFKHVREDLFELAEQYGDGYLPDADGVDTSLPGPIMKKSRMDSRYLAQAKYQTLLHHINDTVIELDVDNSIYHVVYNPNPEFESIIAEASFNDIAKRLMEDGAHPEGVFDADEMQRNFYDDLFVRNMRKRSFRCRIFSHTFNEYFPYEVTMIRVVTDVPEQKLLLAVFHKLESEAPPAAAPIQTELSVSPLLYDLACCALCCSDTPQAQIMEGEANLFALTGYGTEDVRRLFDGSLQKMIVPEDRVVLERMRSDAARHNSRVEGQLRIFCRNAQAVPVLCKLRGYIREDGQECFYCTLFDISSLKKEREQLEIQARRGQIIIDQSEGITFEWELQRDRIICSEKWEKRFGYPLQKELSFERLSKVNHFHPDDLPRLREQAIAVQNGQKVLEQEVRIANKEGRYLWSRIRGTLLLNEFGNPDRLIGIITDIDELKRTAISMKERAERDSLTKLLNKASAQDMIDRYLVEESEKSSAMLVLDLDNFKLVNDNYGHLYGDAVLTRLSSILKQMFRSQDVIARIGGDEFLLFVKDIPGKEMVRKRCRQILEMAREMMGNLMPDLDVSFSIGVAFAPDHGRTYAELFLKADEALYRVKKTGKNQFKFWDEHSRYLTMQETHTNATRIDSNDQPALNNDSFLRFIFSRLYESRNMEDTINELLGFIGAYFNVSRVYIFENNEDNTACSNTFEWCNVGIPAEKDNLQNISYIDDIPGWENVYNEKGILYCTDISELGEPFTGILKPQGIKSMLQSVILDEGRFRGYIGFDECVSNRLWTQEQVEILEYTGRLLAIFLLKYRANHKS